MKKNPFINSRILLVEDEESMAVGLVYNLKEEGYQVKWAKDGKQALEIFDKEEFDLIILDIMLPYHDGFEIARRIRQISPQIPILMLTAKSGSGDRVQGLESGADDYLTKPFHLKELLLRIQGMLKRKQWYKSLTRIQPIFTFGENEVNFDNLSCRNRRGRFQLTPQEAMVLRYLIENQGKIVSRKELLENVWHLKSDVETRTVDNFIARLRRYFEPDPGNPIYIKSIRGAGYIFDTED
ncbi:MAG: response regulator transcription factor [Calditrichia bacterium]